MKEFNEEKLEFHLPKSFKGLDKKYILNCIFDEKIQKNWNPTKGDVIVGSTGNIFVISNVDRLHQSLGGTRYYFGGGSCNRNGGRILDDTYSFTANEDGKWYHPIEGEKENPYHSSIREFRFIPYPHEL